MIAALVAGLLAGYGIAMPVGAVGTYLVALTARTSLRVGACAALGVATADGLYALVAAAGGSALVPVLRPLTGPLRWVSGLVLIVLAVRGAVGAVLRYRADRRAAEAGDEGQDDTEGARERLEPGRAYLGLLGITVMNPMTVVYFAALVLGHQVSAAPGRPAQAVFVLGAFAASASWQLLLAGGGALLGRTLTGRQGRLATGVGSAALICVLAVRLLATAS